MEQVRENKMGTMPIPSLLLSMALPMMVSMLVQALYNVVDSIFVSWIAEDALTAVSMAFPMQNLLIGCGSGLGVGTNALLSRCLGERRKEDANRMAMHGIFLAGCAYLLFLVIALLTARRFFVIQGASEIITAYGTTYLMIVMCFSFGLFLQMMMERLLQSTGLTVYSMLTQGLGAIVNLILDPILIFGYFGFPKMGIAGAAIATVIGQILGALLGIYLNLKLNKELTLTFRGFRPNRRIITQILYIGVPSILMVGIGSVMTFSVNKILVVFSSTAVAVFGAYFKLQSFFFMPIFGMNNGMVPIVAYNLGARRPERMLETRKMAFIYGEVIMLIAFAVMQLLPTKLLGFFNASSEMLAIGVPALRTISISFLVAAICVISSSFFQAVGNGIFSMLLSLFRQLFCLVPLVYLFSRSGSLSMVWWAWPIAECVAIVLILIFNRIIHRKVIAPMQ